jgi:outer membrane receptor protein involved in Fe transport
VADDADFEAGFRCPEASTTPAERTAVEERFWSWVIRRHPEWSGQQGLEYWRQILAAHHCAATVQETAEVSGRLEEVTNEIVPSLGVTAHTISREQIETLPQGDDAPFQQLLLRNPGVVQDSFGEVHVRGEHGNVQYLLNGVLLPESLNGFAQELEPRFVKSVTLIDGSLPAQFGFRTSAVVDVTTKTGDELRGGEVAIYGGSYGLVQPSFQVGGAGSTFDGFVSGSLKQTGLGIEDPTSGTHPLHDDSTQGRGFGYASYHIDPSRRLSVLVSVGTATFEIPDTPGLVPKFSVAGSSSPVSSTLDESQREQNSYVVVAYQETAGDLRYQLAAFTRDGRIAFTPDLTGDLAFNGVASRVDESFLSNGVQADGSLRLGPRHTLRFGALATRETATSDTASAVFPANDAGAQLSDVPIHLTDNRVLHSLLAGVYVQDEWHPIERLTVNYGIRYDSSDAILRERQASPRANLVWLLGGATSLHVGYARYFTPPSLQVIPPDVVATFSGTTNAPQTFVDDPPRAERANYYDLGVTRRIRDGWQVSLDAFDKQAQQLIDLGQFGNAVILAPFNYRTGSIHGIELSSTVRADGISSYANLAYVFTQARDIDSAQFEFPAAELAYIQTNTIRLDHEGEVSATTGVAYTMGPTRAFVDLLYCSGLRAGFANLQKLPAYYPVNLGTDHVVRLPAAGLAIDLRLDVINVLDQTYRLRDGTGVGIAASQYGPRRAVYVGAAALF